MSWKQRLSSFGDTRYNMSFKQFETVYTATKLRGVTLRPYGGGREYDVPLACLGTVLDIYQSGDIEVEFKASRPQTILPNEPLSSSDSDRESGDDEWDEDILVWVMTVKPSDVVPSRCEDHGLRKMLIENHDEKAVLSPNSPLCTPRSDSSSDCEVFTDRTTTSKNEVIAPANATVVPSFRSVPEPTAPSTPDPYKGSMEMAPKTAS